MFMQENNDNQLPFFRNVHAVEKMRMSNNQILYVMNQMTRKNTLSISRVRMFHNCRNWNSNLLDLFSDIKNVLFIHKLSLFQVFMMYAFFIKLVYDMVPESALTKLNLMKHWSCPPIFF